MDKPLKLYEVSRFGRHTAHIEAQDSTTAKRAYCKLWGLSFKDPWCGASTLNARAMKPAEIAAWEAQADTERATFVFIKGMMDIYAKAYADAHTAATVRGGEADAGRRENPL